MKIKKYLLYFLIFIVAGAIAVSIFFAVRDRNNDDIIGDEQAAVEEDDQDTASNQEEIQTITDTEEVEMEEEPEIFNDHYSSSSGEFASYTFKCPQDWVVTEEAGGQTVMIKNAADSSSPESIMIIVEDTADLEAGPEGLLEAYLEIPVSGTINGGIIEGLDADIGGISAELTGYYYDSGLASPSGSGDEAGSSGEIDLITYLIQDDHIYIMKYMSSGLEKDTALERFEGFLEDFTIGGEITGVKETEDPGSINILILGVDSGLGRDWGRGSARSDINMILHINLETYGATIVTIPRDLWVPIPGHDDGKINGAHAIGGPELAVETFEGFSGLDIDNYIITDFDGFIPLIDSLGGVTIEVNENLADGFSNCYLDKGIHHLNGEQALALCRNRHRSGDGSTQGGAWAREREAAKVIKALYEQKTTLEKILALPAFADFLLRYTWTDMDFLDLMRILPVLGNIGTPEIELRGVPSYSKMIGKASAVVHYEDETEQMFDEIKNQ